MKNYVIGVDFGTDSCRGIIADCLDGSEIAEAVFKYPRWAKGMYCEKEKLMYRQHPLDYIEGLDFIFSNLTKNVDAEIINNIVSISVDTTGSTPCFVDENGMPLALSEGFEENPNAMFILWKDHTSIKEACEITLTAKTKSEVDYTKYIGGVYSSEWFFAKALHVLREDVSVRENYATIVEQCDFIPYYLTGVKDYRKIYRSRCAAGHKAMWHKEFGGLPKNEYFCAIDPLLNGITDKLYKDTYTSDYCVGTLSDELSEKFSLPKNIKIGIGAFDCHMGAVGGNINENAIVKVIGTSTCDIVIKNMSEVGDIIIDGICGQVDGSVVKDKLGMEAGQSAFGDFYDWYKKLICWPLKFIQDENERAKIENNILFELEAAAKLLDPSDIITVDWINGRRTPFANQNLKCGIMGLNLSVDAPKLYRSIVESSVYGAKKIIDRFLDSNISITEIIAIGGVAKKSHLAMQILADVTNMNVKVCKSEQAVALGAACFAAVVGGVYKNIEDAQKNMASEIEKIYYPDAEKVEIYKELYLKYNEFSVFLENSVQK